MQGEMAKSPLRTSFGMASTPEALAGRLRLPGDRLLSTSFQSYLGNVGLHRLRSAPRVCIAGRREKPEYSCQSGSHPGNSG